VEYRVTERNRHTRNLLVGESTFRNVKWQKAIETGKSLRGTETDDRTGGRVNEQKKGNREHKN